MNVAESRQGLEIDSSGLAFTRDLDLVVAEVPNAGGLRVPKWMRQGHGRRGSE